MLAQPAQAQKKSWLSFFTLLVAGKDTMLIVQSTVHQKKDEACSFDNRRAKYLASVRDEEDDYP